MRNWVTQSWGTHRRRSLENNSHNMVNIYNFNIELKNIYHFIKLLKYWTNLNLKNASLTKYTTTKTAFHFSDKLDKFLSQSSKIFITGFQNPFAMKLRCCFNYRFWIIMMVSKLTPQLDMSLEWLKSAYFQKYFTYFGGYKLSQFREVFDRSRKLDPAKSYFGGYWWKEISWLGQIFFSRKVYTR